MSGESVCLPGELPDAFKVISFYAQLSIIGKKKDINAGGVATEIGQEGGCLSLCVVRGTDFVYPCHFGAEMQCNSLMCVYSAPVGWPLITALTT